MMRPCRRGVVAYFFYKLCFISNGTDLKITGKIVQFVAAGLRKERLHYRTKNFFFVVPHVKMLREIERLCGRNINDDLPFLTTVRDSEVANVLRREKKDIRDDDIPKVIECLEQWLKFRRYVLEEKDTRDSLFISNWLSVYLLSDEAAHTRLQKR